MFKTALISYETHSGNSDINSILKKLYKSGCNIFIQQSSVPYLDTDVAYTEVVDSELIFNNELPEIVITGIPSIEELLSIDIDAKSLFNKININSIHLIRYYAGNYEKTLVISSTKQYTQLLQILINNDIKISKDIRRQFAIEAFNFTSHYDTLIYKHFTNGIDNNTLKISLPESVKIRYGENPHQQGKFYGKLEDIIEQLHGMEVSYNNLLDIDAANNLISEFSKPTFAIVKHTNPCGVASHKDLERAWILALSTDPVSAYWGVIVTNSKITLEVAKRINKLYFAIIVAPGYAPKALNILKQHPDRMIFRKKKNHGRKIHFRTLLNGIIAQERDLMVEAPEELEVVTRKKPDNAQLEDLLFANKIARHSKSNAIVLVRNNQMIACGVGQTSRVDALRQAAEKAGSFGLSIENAVMASDGFIPFIDTIQIAHKNHIASIIQTGGSGYDKQAIAFCNKHNISMVFTNIRHFKH